MISSWPWSCYPPATNLDKDHVSCGILDLIVALGLLSARNQPEEDGVSCNVLDLVVALSLLSSSKKPERILEKLPPYGRIFLTANADRRAVSFTLAS